MQLYDADEIAKDVGCREGSGFRRPRKSFRNQRSALDFGDPYGRGIRHLFSMT
jgi:hypothetical protein